MPLPVPQTIPRLSYSELLPRVVAAGLDPAKWPFFVVGIRGYYRDTMGVPGQNDRGIYDDAIFLVSPSLFAAFNGNTDPSTRRAGSGTGANKGMARLKSGLWLVHKFDLHKGQYLALCQRGGPITVMRDGHPDYPDTGMHGINIHKGSFNSTSSLGCQTIYPTQWPSFIETAQDQAKRYYGAQYKSKIVPYVLLEN